MTDSNNIESPQKNTCNFKGLHLDDLTDVNSGLKSQHSESTRCPDVPHYYSRLNATTAWWNALTITQEVIGAAVGKAK